MNLKREARLFFLWMLFALSFCAVLAIVCAVTVDAQMTGKETAKMTLTESSTETCTGKTCQLVLNSGPVRTFNGSAWLDFIKTDYVDGYTVGYTEIDKDEYIWVTNITYDLARVCMNVTAQNDNVELPLTKSASNSGGSISNTAFYKLRAGETYCVWTDILNFRTIKFGEHSTTIVLSNQTTHNLEDDDEYMIYTSSDMWLDDVASGGGPSAIKWNITMIPAGATIDIATLQLYTSGTDGGFTNGSDVWQTYCWTNQTWGEEQEVIKDYVVGLSVWSANKTTWSGGALDANNITATSCIQADVTAGRSNSTIVLDVFNMDGTDTYMEYYSKERTAVGNRPMLFITYTAGGDTTKPQPVYVSPTLANNSYTANVSWIFVNASAGEAISYCILQNGTNGNLTMTANGQSCSYNYTGLANLTQKNFRVWFNDSAGNPNVTEWRRITVNLTSYAGCTVTLANTTITNHANISCNASDLLTLNWSWTQWDTHACGSFSNITWYNYSYQACDYCVPSIVNTTHVNHANISCNTSDILTLNWSWTTWDESVCVPDNVANISWHNYTYEACTYCTPDWLNDTWTYVGNITPVYVNVTSCNSSGNLTQYANWTEWNWTALLDFHACDGYANTTVYYANLSWGNWTTLTCVYSPPAPKTVCALKLVLIARDGDFDIGWMFDC
jgi:hypothetical protein